MGGGAGRGLPGHSNAAGAALQPLPGLGSVGCGVTGGERQEQDTRMAVSE